MEDEIKYKKAIEKLEEIVEKMENDDLDIDEMSDQLKEAQRLIKLCKDKLLQADTEIKKILKNDKTE